VDGSGDINGAVHTTRVTGPARRRTFGPVVFRFLADAVVVLHFAFVVFVAVGGLLAWRWPWVLVPHVPAVIWGVGIVTVGYDCPLTPLERYLRERGGERPGTGGFIDRYVEGVIYPEDLTPLLRTLAAVLIAVGWAGAIVRLRRARRAPGLGA
jgi:hypothetical protein